MKGEAAFFLIGFYFLLTAPYTKVEESSSVQAVHDLLFNPSVYDHQLFPGAVPRTAISALLTAIPLYPLLPFIDKPSILFASRLILLAIYTHSIYALRIAISGYFSSKRISLLFSMLNFCTFHLTFYSSRFLGNIVASVLINHAVACLLLSVVFLDGVDKSKFKKEKKQPPQTITLYQNTFLFLLLATPIIFRSELILLSISLLFSEIFIYKSIPLTSTTLEIIFKHISKSVLLTCLVDSWWYGELGYWPEIRGFWFNVVENNAKLWGVLPYHAYFTQLLPKISPLSYPLSIISLFLSPKIRRILLPTLVFVVLYSGLEHKEWRFIVYTVPILNLGAAVTLFKLSKYRLGKLTIFCTMMALLAVSFGKGWVSSLNYPGGVGMEYLNGLEEKEMRVWIDAEWAMNGVNKFSEVHPTWTYDKSESYRTYGALLDTDYTHLLVGPELYAKFPFEENFEVLFSVRSFKRLKRTGEVNVNRLLDIFGLKIVGRKFIDTVDLTILSGKGGILDEVMVKILEAAGTVIEWNEGYVCLARKVEEVEKFDF